MVRTDLITTHGSKCPPMLRASIAEVRFRKPGVALICIHMHGRYHHIEDFGEVDGVNPSLSVMESAGAGPDQWIVLALPEFKGWKIFSASEGQYEIRLALTNFAEGS